MSFMAGFADGFAKSFGAAEERRHERKQDAFRVAYDSYMKKKDDFEAAKKKDTELVNSAKGIVAMARDSNPNTPESAWQTAYKYLQTGLPSDNVLERIEKTTFAAATEPSMSEEPTDLMTETQASGLTPAPVAAPAQPEPTAPQGQGGLLGMLSGLAQNGEKMRMERANNDVAQSVGQEDWDAVNKGYTPTEVGPGPKVEGYNPGDGTGLGGEMKDQQMVSTKDGKFLSGWRQADGSFRTQNGQLLDPSQIDSIRSMEEFGKYQELLGQLGDDKKPLMEDRAKTVTLANDIATLVEMANADGLVLTQAGQFAATLEGIGREIVGGLEIMKQWAPQDWKTKIEEDELAMQGALVTDGSTPEAARAYASQLVKVQYAMARAMSGAGAMSNFDVRSAEKVLSSNNPAVFQQQAQQFVDSIVGAYNEEARFILNNDIQVQHAKAMGMDVDGFLGPIGEDVSTMPAPKATDEDKAAALKKVDGANIEDQANRKEVKTGVVDQAFLDENPKLASQLKEAMGKTYHIYQVGNETIIEWDD
jgi:hypothetical protein